jgi:rubredoxin
MGLDIGEYKDPAGLDGNQPLKQRSDPRSFDLSLLCPLCGHKIQPWEILRLDFDLVRCPACEQVFDQMQGRKRVSTS